MSHRLVSLPVKEQRGSRARCLLLTDGSPVDVAQRLTGLIAPYGIVDPARHVWMPRGIGEPQEARLGEATAFLTEAQREAVLDWWLAVRPRANTPNWDLAATATIQGREGLLLVEAKAHACELKREGKPDGYQGNHKRIEGAIQQADAVLNGLVAGWALSRDSHYQLSNRFAWAWKLATLGVPVALAYLGFLNAEEMRENGPLFSSHAEWERVMREHGSGIVPDAVWGQPLSVQGTPLIATLQSLTVPL